MNEYFPVENPEEESELTLLEKILSLFRNDSPEAKKKKLLKDIQKILKKHKYKFINVKTEEAQPALAKFYYHIYRVTAIPAGIISGQEQSPALKYLFIDSQLSEKQKNLISRLTPDIVEKRLTDNPASSENIKKELAVFLKSISEEQKNSISRLYRQYLVFLKLLKFDYYFLLRKFDSSFAEMDFKYKPSFSAITCDYITDDLVDSLAIFPLILRYSSWTEVFDVLRDFKNQDIISRDDWDKLFKIMGAVYSSEIILYIVKLITKNPYYTAAAEEVSESIVEDYLSRLNTSVEMIIQKIAIEKRNAKRDMLLNKIFKTTAVSRMKNYTEANNGVFKSKMLGGYMYVDLMNYLKAFMLDYIKKDVMRLVNHLVVRAEWKTNNHSKELSDSMEELITLSDRINQFDNLLAGDEELGVKINTYMKRLTSDPKYKSEIKKLLFDINSRVVAMSQDAYRNLGRIATNINMLLPEFDDPPAMAVIINSEQVKSSYGSSITEEIKTIYGQIYNFLTLLKLMFSK